MRDILPDGYEYKILSCNEGELKDENLSFTAEVRVNCHTEADVNSFCLISTSAVGAVTTWRLVDKTKGKQAGQDTGDTGSAALTSPKKGTEKTFSLERIQSVQPV